jgi:circadian clock protein KaiC
MARKSARTQAALHRAPLEVLATGVPGLDEIMGGGLPALSFNLVAGGPGAGKTTLAMQILFANASAERPGLFFTLLGETSLKMLRYQQQFSFFDLDRIGHDIHFLNLSDDVLNGSLDDVLARIISEVESIQPAFVVVDSFRSLVRAQGSQNSEQQLEHFVQQLALHLTTWEVTSFLIGEYESQELRNPVFTVADDIIWLSQVADRNSVVRKLQLVKARGMPAMPGLHTLKMSRDGIQVFPRITEQHRDPRRRTGARLSSGIAGLDEMMGGGITVGDSLVLAGPSGSGKTTFALQFVAAGLRRGEAAVVAVFEEHPDAYLERARSFGTDFREAERNGKLRILFLRPLDLSVDETLDEMRKQAREIGATRLVIDSISGFEMALAPTFRSDFRESLYRLISAVTAIGVTVFSTVEVLESRDRLQLTGYQISFLTDDIINLLYVEISGELRKALAVIKMRGSRHSTVFREYDLTEAGVLLREPLTDFDAIGTGMPVRHFRSAWPAHPGLTEREVLLLQTLIRTGAVAARQLAALIGSPLADVEGSLDRLLQLRYVVKDGTRYAAVARAPGM